jgi:hypothetical protein
MSCLTNLQELHITGCRSLAALPDGLRSLTHTLMVFVLEGCTALTALPSWLTCLTQLHTLDLRRCDSLAGDGDAAVVDVLRSQGCRVRR